jgi:hypothetical protein
MDALNVSRAVAEPGVLPFLRQEPLLRPTPCYPAWMDALNVSRAVAGRERRILDRKRKYKNRSGDRLTECEGVW